jgi:hypothetical protein
MVSLLALALVVGVCAPIVPDGEREVKQQKSLVFSTGDGIGSSP